MVENAGMILARFYVREGNLNLSLGHAIKNMVWKGELLQNGSNKNAGSDCEVSHSILLGVQIFPTKYS